MLTRFGRRGGCKAAAPSGRGLPMRPIDHAKGSRLGEGVMTLKQAYSEECHVRSKT